MSQNFSSVYALQLLYRETVITDCNIALMLMYTYATCNNSATIYTDCWLLVGKSAPRCTAGLDCLTSLDWLRAARQWQLRTLDYLLIHSGRTRVFLSRHRPSVVLLGIRRGLSDCSEPAAGRWAPRIRCWSADHITSHTSYSQHSQMLRRRHHSHTSHTHAFCICIPKHRNSSAAAAYWFNTSLYTLCIERALTPSSALRLNTVYYLHIIVNWRSPCEKDIGFAHCNHVYTYI